MHFLLLLVLGNFKSEPRMLGLIPLLGMVCFAMSLSDACVRLLLCFMHMLTRGT